MRYKRRRNDVWHRSFAPGLIPFCYIFAAELLFEGFGGGGVRKAPATDIFEAVTEPNLNIARAVKI